MAVGGLHGGTGLQIAPPLLFLWTLLAAAAAGAGAAPAVFGPATDQHAQAPRLLGRSCQLQQADDAAYAALSAAQKIVRNHNEGAGPIQTAVFNATQAVNAFANITKALGVN